ncbi:MAG TPA: nitroreductase family protein [Dehalococcoidia bacterium]
MSDEPGIFEVMYTTRAMRRLKPDAVPEELLLKLVDAANQAASASNSQVARWVIVRDRDAVGKIAELNRAVAFAYANAGGSRPPSLPHQSDEARERQRKAFLWQARHLHECPAIIVACQEAAGSRADTFAAGAGAGGSIWPQVQNLLLAARALGLGATPTTLPMANRAAFREALALPENVEAFCVIPVGWPIGKFGPVSRKPVSEIVHWEQW